MSLMKIHYITADDVNKFKDMYQKVKTPKDVDPKTEFDYIKKYIKKYTDSSDANIKEKATQLNNYFNSYIKLRENIKTLSTLSSDEAYNNPENVKKLKDTMNLMDTLVGTDNAPGFAEVLRDFNAATKFDAGSEKAFYDLTTITCNIEGLAMDVEELAINECNAEGLERRDTATAIHNSIEQYNEDIIDLRAFVIANQTEAPSNAQEIVDVTKKVCSDALVGIKKVEHDIKTFTAQKEGFEVGFNNAQTEVGNLDNEMTRRHGNIKKLENEINDLQGEMNKLKIERQKQMSETKETIAQYTIEIDGESKDELYERQSDLLEQIAALSGFIGNVKDDNARATQNYVKQTEKVMEPYNLLGTGSMTSAIRIKSFLEDGNGEYLDSFIKDGYEKRARHNKALAQYNKDLNNDPEKAPVLIEDPMFTVYAAFADEYEKEHKGQAKEKFKEMCENAVAAEFVWKESQKEEEDFKSFLKDPNLVEIVLRNYKSFLDQQGKSDEYQGLSDKELLTMDKIGKYYYYHEKDWAEADETKRAEYLKNDPGISLIQKSTLYLDAEGNLLYGKEIKNAKEKVEVEASVASEFKDLIAEKVEKDRTAKAKEAKDKGFFRNLFTSSSVVIVEKINLTDEQLSSIRKSAKNVAPKYEYERKLYPVDYENYQEYKKQETEFAKEFPNKKYNGETVLMNAFKKSIKGEFDKAVSRIKLPKLKDYTAESELLQKYMIEKEQVTNQIKQVIVKQNEQKLSKEKLQSIYDIDLKEQQKYEENLQKLQKKIDSTNERIKEENELLDNAVDEYNKACDRRSDYNDKILNSENEIQNAQEQRKELQNIYLKNNEKVTVYTKLVEKTKNIEKKLPVIEKSLKQYNKKFSHEQEPDMRIERCLKKVNNLIMRQNDCANGHTNTNEYDKMIEGLTNLKSVLENQKSKTADISKALTDAKKGAEDYVAKKLKYRGAWGSDLRHVRLNFAKELGLWAGEMAKNIQKKINADFIQTKLEKDLFSFNTQDLIRPNEIDGFKTEMSKSGMNYEVLKQRQEGIKKFEEARAHSTEDNGLESIMFAGLRM